MTLSHNRPIKAGWCVASLVLATLVSFIWLAVPPLSEAQAASISDSRGSNRTTDIRIKPCAAVRLGRQPAAQTLRSVSFEAGPAGTASEPAGSGGPSLLGASFFDVVSEEMHPDTSLQLVPPSDRLGRAFTMGDGRVCVLELEGFLLRALTSTDGGVSFGPEVNIAGGGGGGAVRQYSASLSTDGRLYVAYIAADPGGDLGLWFTRSDDLGLNWDPPIPLVANGDPTHGVQDLVLETGGSGGGGGGRVAILYRGDGGWDPYVTSSSDFGINWTVPVRVDAGVPSRTYRAEWIDLAIDGGGGIYVAYTQSRGGGGGGGGRASVWKTRSTNGGLSFDPESSLDLLLPFHGTSERVDMRVANDGGILIAFWDSGGGATTTDRVYCARSTNQGFSYSLALNAQYTSNSETSFPVVLATATGTATTFVFTADDTNRLLAYRSTTNGSSFGLPMTLATASAGSPADGRPYTRIAWSRVGTTWVVGWTDHAADTYARQRTDVYARSSNDEGTSWKAAVRVDSDAPGSTASAIESVVAADPNSVFVLYQDGRPDDGRSFNYWGNRSTANPILFGLDYRIDTDGMPVTGTALTDVTLATDGGSNLYVAFPAIDIGPFPTIHVGRSGDGGYLPVSFTAALGPPPLGGRIEVAPTLKATSDGFVYVAWTSDDPSGLREVRFNRSYDFGATWLAADVVLGSYLHDPGSSNTPQVPSIQIAALAGGTAHVAWTDGMEVYLSTWDENSGGIYTRDVDQDTRRRNDSSQVCANGSQLLVVYRSPNLALTSDSVWATVSNDGGNSWEPKVQLREEMAGGIVIKPDLGCPSTPTTATAQVLPAVWSDTRDGVNQRLYSNMFDGVIWTGEAPVAAPIGLDLRFTGPTIVSHTAAVLSYEDLSGRVYVARNAGGGPIFDSYAQVDLGAPDPDADSTQPALTTDGAGNIWVSWLDWSAGLPEIVVAHSADGGATFGPVMRLSRTLPQGTRMRSYNPYVVHAAALPGVAFVGWAGEGDAATNNVVINAFDLDDSDRDRTGNAQDCDSSNPRVWLVPDMPKSVTVTAMNPDPLPGEEVLVRLSWDSQDAAAGPETSYDIVTGRMSQLRRWREYSEAMCLVGGWPDTPFHDPQPGPAIGDVYYYLIRAKNSCGMSTYGDSSLMPDPRDMLDGPWPCP